MLVDRSDILITIPALPERLSDTAVIPLSILQGGFPPGETVYIQAFTAGCSFMAPFRASNALAVSSQPSPEANIAETGRPRHPGGVPTSTASHLPQVNTVSVPQTSTSICLPRSTRLTLILNESIMAT